MSWKEKLALELDDHLHATLQIRDWADRRAHLLPAGFLTSLRELEGELELLRQKIRM
jgi:hypothetical protein